MIQNIKIILYLLCLSLLTACSVTPKVQDGAPKQKVDVSKIPNAVPRVEPKSKYGNPKSYVVNGRRYYVLKSAKGYDKKGIGSWYGTKFHGQLTSTREPYNMFAMTAASTELPLPTYARVTDLENGRQIIVEVNDRGPFNQDRIIDLSYAAAEKLGYANKGTALVEVTAIDPHKPKLYVQVGAFSNIHSATKLRTDVAAITKDPIRISTSSHNKKPIYRVQVGPLANIAENDRVQQLLAAKGFGHGIAVVD